MQQNRLCIIIRVWLCFACVITALQALIKTMCRVVAYCHQFYKGFVFCCPFFCLLKQPCLWLDSVFNVPAHRVTVLYTRTSAVHTGVLCGACDEGSGLSVLLSRCVSCSSLYSMLILGLIIVDVLIILLLLILMKPVPLWFYPILCHVQLLPLFTEYFPVTFELVRPYLLFVASALGLYFPYDFCVSSELDAVGAYGLRYLPPLLAVVVSIIVLLVQ